MTIILCNGKYPEHPIPLSYINCFNQLVCCDGAVVNLIKHGFTPYVIVGDLDSLPQQFQEQFKSILYHIPEQDTNDLTKAVDWCIQRNLNDLIILAATGLRDDHAIGNIGLLAKYQQKVKVKMLTDTGIFTPINKTSNFVSFTGQKVSIFSLTPDTWVSATGLKYKVDQCFKNWHEGTLNEALSDEFEIQFTEGELIIYTSYPETIS